MIELFVYTLSLIVCTFGVTGINFDGFIKKGHIWEARILSFIIVIALSYCVANFILAICNIQIIR